MLFKMHRKNEKIFIFLKLAFSFYLLKLTLF